MTETAPAGPRRPETFGAGLRRRIALTGWSLAYVLLAVPALVLLCVVTTSLSVAVVGVGLVLLFIFVPLLAGLTGLHRAMASHLLGVEIERPYRRTSGSGLRLLREWAGDPARWRDFGWTWMSVTLGWALAWIGLGLGLAVAWYAVFPLVWSLTPTGTFEVNYGIIRIDT